MPQLERQIVKERAARLRARGDERLVQFLDAQVGSTASVLVEKTGVGRTPQFAEVRVPEDDSVANTFISVRLTSHDGVRLSGQLQQMPSRHCDLEVVG
jgi:threonylcarbamoyladenosine tRNA methylthiotransferase MtaB